MTLIMYVFIGIIVGLFVNYFLYKMYIMLGYLNDGDEDVNIIEKCIMYNIYLQKK